MNDINNNELIDLLKNTLITPEQIRTQIENDGFALSKLVKIFLSDDKFSQYFSQKNYNSNFFQILDKFIFNQTLSNFSFFFMALGCSIKLKKIAMYPSQKYELDLSNDIDNGKLIYINYTPNSGNLFPVELHGNSPMGHEYNVKKTLYPVPFNHSTSCSQKTDISILYCYATGNLTSDISLNELVEAFKNYQKGDYSLMIIQLQISCEFILNRFLSQNGYFPDRKAERKPYHQKLTQMLPKATKEHSWVDCPQFIIDDLGNMREKRNDIAHEGGYISIKDDEAHKYLVSSFLFYKYFKVVHRI